MNRSDPVQTTQIQICRVLCIFFMMSVHVNPGASGASFVTTGTFAPLGDIWLNFIGRTSVAALSLISGYLLFESARRTPSLQLIGKKFRTLVVPMMTWSVVFLAVLLIGRFGFEEPLRSLDLTALGLLDAITGLFGPTVNLSLFFLRDLFASMVLVIVCLGAIRRAPWVAIGVALVIALFDLLEPVVFRPSILFFVVTGTALASRGIAPRTLARPIVFLPGLGVCLAAYALLSSGDWASHQLQRESLDLLRRSTLTLAMLALAGGLARFGIGRTLAGMGGSVFESYLMHSTLISVAWIVWQKFMGTAMEPSYLAFFFLAPVGAMAAGALFGAVADGLPAPVQILVRGKVRHRNSGRAARAFSS
jgi:fucose 4-O-acetylase-like acetyltransferase